MTRDIEVAREGAVLSAAFARPQKKNAITGAMYEALIEAFDEAERDSEIGALLMSGKGGVFTAGNDIGDFLAVALRETGEFPAWRFVSKVAEFEKPLIAAIDGIAIGVGTTLCLHCDLVYATPETRFQTPFVNLGLVPEAGSSLLAPQRFGRARAPKLLLLAEPFGADRALELGLINAVVPQSELMAHAMSKAAALAAKPRAALLATRRLMRGDPRGAESADGGRNARLQRRPQIPRSACGVPGVSRGGKEVATVNLFARFRPEAQGRCYRVDAASRREAGHSSELSPDARMRRRRHCDCSSSNAWPSGSWIKHTRVAVCQGHRAVPLIETVCSEHQTAGCNGGRPSDRRRAAHRRPISKQFNVRRRGLGGKGHDINGDVVKIVQCILRRTAVDLTRLQREPEPRSIKGDASVGVGDGYSGMVNASLGSRIGSGELDQFERMAVGVAKLERNDAAGKRLRAMTGDGGERKRGEPFISRGDVVGDERTMLEPEVVAATIRGIERARGIERRKFEALPSSPQEDGAERPRAEQMGETRICIELWRRLKTEGPRVEGSGGS